MTSALALFSYHTHLVQDDGPWRLGMPQQRAAYMAKLGDVAQHLDAIFILVFGVGGGPLLEQELKHLPTAHWRSGATRLALTRRQPGFPLIQRNASGLASSRAYSEASQGRDNARHTGGRGVVRLLGQH